MLLWLQRLQRQQIFKSDIREHLVFATLTLRHHHFGVTIKLENTPLGAQLEITSADLNTGRQILGRRHLTGHELTPDQLIQALGITLHTLQISLLELDVGGANRFVRFLRAFLTAVRVRLLWQVILTKGFFNIVARHADGIDRKIGRVGTHVGDITRFIQTLGHHHGLLHTEAQARTGSLLQRGGNKRCVGA